MKLGTFGVKSQCKICTKQWFLENHDSISKRKKSKYSREYIKNYRKTRKKSINEIIAERLRTRLWFAIKNNQKVGSAVRDLGCSIDHLKSHLESKFQEGMTWENYGLRGWHIDHIVPLSKVDLSNKESFLKVCHYTNLQPLWAKDNLSKRNKLVG
jgi:hypothetical protein